MTVPAQLSVLDSTGATIAVNAPLSPGQATAAESRPVTLSTENVAILGAANETAPATDTASSGLNGRLQRIAQRITSQIALLPASLGAKPAANSLAVTLATDDAAVTTLGATTDAAVTAGATGSIAAKLRSISRDIVANIVLAAGSNLIGRTVADASSATGGVPSTARLASSAASTNAAVAKASAGRLYAIQGKNNAAYDVFLCLYDLAASPTVGTSTLRKKICLPAGSAFALDFPLGLSFSTGIAYALTKLVADNDTTAVAAADITALNLDYA